MKRTQRGQSMLLFALTLLLLTGMTLITLQLGMRTRERMEAQMVADAAAYSQAVATARAYNTIAVMNRAGIAHAVALLGTESLVSWSGQIRSGGTALAAAVESCPGGRAAAATLRANLANNAMWEQLDDRAGDLARQHQGSGGVLGQSQDFHQNALVNGLLARQTLAKAIATRANPELQAPDLGDAKSIAETAPNCSTGATCSAGDTLGYLSAVMGSRGWEFTTNRSGIGNALAAGIEGAAGGLPITVTVLGTGAGGGSGYGDDPYDPYPDSGGDAVHLSQTAEGMSSVAAWAEDHAARLQIRFGNCSPPPVTIGAAQVMSSALEFRTDMHDYGGGNERDPAVRHTLGACSPYCPGVFGGFFAYNTQRLFGDENARDDFGQPKLYALISRDYNQRATQDPWSMVFRMNSGGTSTFDNRGVVSAGGANLGLQGALSAGLVYYHRPWNGGNAGGFLEPPNLFNPFWRATLAAPDNDVADRVAAAGFTDSAAAIRLLLAAGMRGTRRE